MPKPLFARDAPYLETRAAADWLALCVAVAALTAAVLPPVLGTPDRALPDLPVPAPVVARPLPDLSALDAPARKTVFFGYLRPIVAEVSGEIAFERAFVLDVAARVADGQLPSRAVRARVDALAERYDVYAGQDAALADVLADVLAELAMRVDMVPTSLVLVQAAKESGWGTSRFAVQGNSLFGQRCYEPGCGLAPAGRANSTFSVRTFPTIADSVRSYVHNLNTNERYAEFRRVRSSQRESADRLNGVELAATLVSYSERRAQYVSDITAMIVQTGAAAHD